MLEIYPGIVFGVPGGTKVRSKNAEVACKETLSGVRRWGADDGRLAGSLGSMTPEMRYRVPIVFQEMFKKDLRVLVESKFGKSALRTTVQLLAVSPPESECLMLKTACGGSKDEALVFSIISGRSNREIGLLRAKFFEMYQVNLADTISFQLGDHLKALAYILLQGKEEVYDESHHNYEKVARDVAELHRMTQEGWARNEVGVFKILCLSPSEYLQKVNMAYAHEHGRNLMKMMSRELKGGVGDAAKIMLGMKLKPLDTVADLIKSASAKFSTSPLLLVSCLIRYQPILRKVNRIHPEIFDRYIEDSIKKDVGEEYRSLLGTIVKTGMSL